MREITQARGPVDRRSDVVAFIAQSHLAGMQSDPQPDRRQGCSLQRECARHRIAGASERKYETIALPLFNRAHTVVGSGQIGQYVIETCNGGGHLIGL
jgi:hypothetical protein